MEQTALRPKPMPGQDSGAPRPPGPAGPPPVPRGRRRRLTTVLCGLLAATLLLLAGVGLGTVGATVIGMSRLAELQQRAGASAPGAPAGAGSAPAPARPAPAPAATPPPAPAGATLGVEVVDDERAGALVTGVHVPGPGHTAGLVRGDVVVAFGTARIDSASGLARAVARARPGEKVLLTVRHESGGHQRLAAVPGVVA
ncbi:PDZ domain-containing protein [Streptomyces sp. NPDC018947]|uniref:PDZ domain-containing protein n=1 Tax=Streptomyces sp. NPDC018947 TaxID=3365054 RepID=UPI00378F83C8